MFANKYTYFCNNIITEQKGNYSVRMECADILEVCHNYFEIYGINNRDYYLLCISNIFTRDEMSVMLFE